LPWFWARAAIGHIGNITFIWMFKLLPLGIGSTIVYSNPILISLMSHYLLNEPATRDEVIGIFVSFIGIVLMSMGKEASALEQERADYKLGIALALFTCFTVSGLTILTRKLKGV
jgi:drug/metabolite transporter (DMT)-like permease